MGAIWEADGAIWEVCVPYGSHVHWIGAIWEPDSTIWKEDGTIQESHMPLWEPHMHQTELPALYESQMTLCGSHM
jgi:hypothetical protein